jgi:hypothetical protein
MYHLQAAMVVSGGGDFDSVGAASNNSSGMMCPSEPQSMADDVDGQYEDMKGFKIDIEQQRLPSRQSSMSRILRRPLPAGSKFGLSFSLASSSSSAGSMRRSGGGGATPKVIEAAAVLSIKRDPSSVEAVAVVKQMVLSQIDKKLKDLRKVEDRER